jgi:hypothetical protein
VLPRGYLGEVDFFIWERGLSLGVEEEDEDEVQNALEDGNTTALGGGVNQEVQPANLTEEAIEMDISQSMLNQLSEWDGLTVQL